MKLPHHLMKSYREYKEQEQSLLLWIEETATASGYVLQTGNEKLKGRARTLARRATATQRSNSNKAPLTSSTSLEEPTITILEILPRVEAIARNSEILSIPAQIAEQFTAIRDLRKACLDWFRTNTNQHDTETRKKNSKHVFPLRIITGAIGLLRSKFPIQQMTSSEMTPGMKVHSTTATNNLFGHLPLEESDDIPCSSTQTVKEHGTTSPSVDLPRVSELTKEEQLQDEFNIAKFCMLRDIQQIEDFIIQELVRYSLDQANADVLPFLSNTAIDIVAKMESLLYENFEWKKFEEGFLNTIVSPNENVMWSSPQLRMQNALSTQRKKIQGISGLKMFPTEGLSFNAAQLPYFGMPREQQMFAEQLFIESLIRNEQEGTWGENNLMYLDSVPVYMKKFASTKDTFGENYYAVAAPAAFGARIALLAALILQDTPLVSLALLQKTGSKHARLESSREDFWSTPEYKSSVVAGLWKDRLELILERQKISYTNYENSVNERKATLPAYHMVCALNNCHIRMRYATTSIAAMEVCSIIKVLAQLWNLLREDGHLNIVWSDMEFLLSALGEEYLFQYTRPTSVSSDPGVIRSRILHGMGFTKKDLENKTNHSHGYGVIKAKLRLKERFNLSCYPLYSQLTKRGEYPVGITDGAVDSELIATATVIPHLIGQKPQAVLFNFKAQIENKAALWKLRDQGPGLQATELLGVVKKGLQKEFRMADFDYLGFE